LGEKPDGFLFDQVVKEEDLVKETDTREDHLQEPEAEEEEEKKSVQSPKSSSRGFVSKSNTKRNKARTSNRNSAALSPRSEQEVRKSVKDLKMADYFSAKPSQSSQIIVKDEAPGHQEELKLITQLE